MTKSTRNMRFAQVVKEELSDVLFRPAVFSYEEIQERIAYFDSMISLDADGMWKKWYPRTNRPTSSRKLEAHFCVQNPSEIDPRSKKERRLTWCEVCIEHFSGKPWDGRLGK